MTPARAPEPALGTLRRRIPARCEEVYDAWLDADSVSQWMCPGEINRTVARIDARVGGRFSIEMHEAGGARFQHSGEYLVLDRPRRIAFTWISEATGNRASRVTIDLRPDGDDTDLTLRHEGLEPQAVERHHLGWGTILDKLAARAPHLRRSQ